MSKIPDALMAAAEAVIDAASKKNKPVDQRPVSVVRDGTKIIIPPDMTYKDARYWLEQQEQAEDKTVNVHFEIVSYPMDAIVALMKALRERYQFTQLKDTPGWWADNPPVLIQVDLGNGQFETAPLGRFAPPMFEGGFLETKVHPQWGMKLIISGTIKRKFEPEVKEVIKRTQDFLKAESIYKGRAIMVDLAWVSGERGIDPINDAPKFWDVSGIDQSQLILNPTVEFDLTTNIWTLIESKQACINNSIPIKHGCLLGGAFGTGKTLTAKVTAAKAVRNGFTFIYLKNAAHLAEALKMAEMYAPAVLFAEDIDQAVTDERDEEVNKILNTLDGVDTKSMEIITILTTNYVEKISKAFLRAGRMDTVINYTLPEPLTAERFVRFYATDDDNKSLLAPDVDLTKSGTILAGLVPAFIAEAVQKAKRRTIHRTKESNIAGLVTAEDIELAAASLRAHMEMTTEKKEMSEDQEIADAARLLNSI